MFHVMWHMTLTKWSSRLQFRHHSGLWSTLERKRSAPEKDRLISSGLRTTQIVLRKKRFTAVCLSIFCVEMTPVTFLTGRLQDHRYGLNNVLSHQCPRSEGTRMVCWCLKQSLPYTTCGQVIFMAMYNIFVICRRQVMFHFYHLRCPSKVINLHPI